MKPILFNTEMVRAILDGHKTVTRRLVKPQPSSTMFTGVCTESTMRNDKTVGCFMFGDQCGEIKDSIKPPYKVGDILYVRETWSEWTDGYVYKVPDTKAGYNYPASYVGKWKPSIHMPKEAARIFLKVTNVRVERLQDITEDQARNEGCITYNEKIGDGIFEDVIEFDLTTIDAFAELWNSTVDLKNKPQLSWSSNPWVWVIEFSRISKEEAQCYTL